MPTLQINDVTLHYDKVGDGDPALVFVHGMCGGGWVWADQMARLSDRFTCVAYDRRAHSRSTGSAEAAEQGIASQAGDLAALSEELGLDRPVLVGSSSGAVIALELLHRHPDLVRGAVLSEPPAFHLDPSAGAELKSAVLGPLQDAVRRDGPEAAVPAFFSVVCPPMWGKLDDAARQRYVDNTPLLFATLEAPPSTMTLADVAAIEVPTCAVSGSESLPLFRSLVKLIATTMPDARHVELEGASHATYGDAPEEFARIVAAFATEASGVRPNARR